MMLFTMWGCLWWQDQPWCKSSRWCSGNYLNARFASRLCQHDSARVWKIMQEEDMKRREQICNGASSGARAEVELAAKEGYTLVGIEHIQHDKRCQ